MKKYGALIAFLMAIGFGALAVMLANQWVASRGLNTKPAVQAEIPVAKIVVAAKEIQMGTLLTSDMLILADWPKVNAPPGSFTSVELLKGRVAKASLVAGEPFLEGKLAEPGSGAGLASMIPTGMRAMSIKVDEVIGVSGFILPNTFVDILSVDNERDKAAKVTTILEKIKVLAIAQEVYTENSKPKVVRTVTLEVSPQQGEKLALYTNNSVIHLALRNPLDTNKAVSASPPPKVVRKPRLVHRRTAPSPTSQLLEVDVIKGKDREKIKFKSADLTERT